MQSIRVILLLVNILCVNGLESNNALVFQTADRFCYSQCGLTGTVSYGVQVSNTYGNELTDGGTEKNSFFRTHRFKGILCILAVSVVFLAHKLRLKSYRKMKKELEYLVELRTKELVEANRKLQAMASTDGMTDIPNHRCFVNFFRKEWKRCARSGKPMSVIMIDVDFFKLFNDGYGHQKGDRCLKSIAQCLNNTVKRPGDFVARYGGEEFVVVLPETDRDGAFKTAQELRQAVVDLKIAHKYREDVDYVTISLGLATVIPDLNVEPHTLLDNADKELYKAKDSGRDTVSVMEMG